MTLREDSNLNRHCLMLMKLMDQSGSMELFRKPVEGVLALGLKLIGRGFHPSRRRTSVIQRGIVCRMGTSR
jgi:hypothetical protein